nr:BatD family protein [Bacteroidota bacterium]
MNHLRTYLILLLSTGFSMLMLAQDVKLSADVDKNPVATDEQFTLEFTVSTSGGSARSLKLPDLGKFLILSGPNQSTSMQIINGTVTSSQSYSYVLQPREVGKFTIGPASVEVNGSQYSSNSIEMTVTKATGQKKAQAQAQQGETIDIGDNLFIRAVIDRSRVYQGEQ